MQGGEADGGRSFLRNPIRGFGSPANRPGTKGSGTQHRQAQACVSLTFFFCFFSQPPAPPWHMEVPRLGVESEPRLPPIPQLQHQILNPLSETWDRTCNLMVPSRTRFHCATMGTPQHTFLTTQAHPSPSSVPLKSELFPEFACSISTAPASLQTPIIPYLPKKTLRVQNEEADTEQRELSCIAGGKAKWYSHFGRQLGSIL